MKLSNIYAIWNGSSRLKWIMQFSLGSLALLLSGCSLMQSRMQNQGDSQVGSWAESSSDQSNTQREIQKREQYLNNRRELEQYSKVLPWFESPEERLEFLRLPGLETRTAWIQSKGIFSRPFSWENKYASVIETQDITIGMPESLVKKSWGEPDSVEVSGHPLFKNMRWKYTMQSASEAGFIQQKRVVYFEAGQVTGWDSDTY